ncbi:MAG: hypothetical protein K6A36_01860 [Paludibacteraceae bacterium]|nr:hypothetical protein [Paludibacteraceae bacterium]
MKKFTTLLMSLMLLSTALWAEETITVSANSSDISEGLDLKVVAKLFAEARNLEEFETMLNNPDSAFCNLDLNGDGQVDYLRVVETGEGNKRLIVLQAILAKDIYQDVASIYVEKDEATNNVSVQVVGDEYVYGTNYIIEPVYVYRPYIYDWFWSPSWYAWHSPWYWEYYPTWWHVHHCWAHDWYWHRCYAYHHHHHWCSFRPGRSIRHGYHDLYHHVRRHDYAMAHPNHSFEHRNSGIRNAREIRSQHAANYRQSYATGHAPQRQSFNSSTAPAFSRESRTYGSRTTAYNRVSNAQPSRHDGTQYRSAQVQRSTTNGQTQRVSYSNQTQRSAANTHSQYRGSSNGQTYRTSGNTQTQQRSTGNTQTVRRPTQSSTSTSSSVRTSGSSNTQRSSGSYNGGYRSSGSSSSYSGGHRSSSSSSYSGSSRSGSSSSYSSGRSSSSSSYSGSRSSGSSYSGGSRSSGSYSGGSHSSGGSRSSGSSSGSHRR